MKVPIDEQAFLVAIPYGSNVANEFVVRSIIEAYEAAKSSGRFTIAHDGFSGDVIGHYITREGKRGVVLQQVGTRVVHVYGERWLAHSDVVSPVSPTMTQSEMARAHGYTGDCCTTCGMFRMKQSGHCFVCDTCGTTTGCS